MDLSANFLKIYSLFSLLRKYLKRKKTPIPFSERKNLKQKKQVNKYLETKIEVNKIVSRELREKQEKKRQLYQKNFGEFEMPKVETPKFSHRSSSEVRAELAKVPFRYRITNYCGEDRAYFRFKNNTLLQKEDSPDLERSLPRIQREIEKSNSVDLELR